MFTELEKNSLVNLGGLHVIGTERHESRRIDNQLRGRAGRQGDPGSNRFLLSLDDSLFRAFGGEKLKSMMSIYNIDELPIESKMLTASIDDAQKKIENYFFDMRKNLFDYDQVLNTQRERIYAERKLALVAEDLTTKIHEYTVRTIDEIIDLNLKDIVDKPVVEWPLDKLTVKIKQFCYLLDDLTVETLQNQCIGNKPLDSLRKYLRKRGIEAYLHKRKTVDDLSPGLMASAERYFLLQQIDNLWKEHLKATKFLQQAVYLRGYASKDPLTEYKLEGYNLFYDMMAQIRRNVVYNLYSFQPAKIKT
jgi:preprotein translocase subunit SecA